MWDETNPLKKHSLRRNSIGAEFHTDANINKKLDCLTFSTLKTFNQNVKATVCVTTFRYVGKIITRIKMPKKAIENQIKRDDRKKFNNFECIFNHAMGEFIIEFKITAASKVFICHQSDFDPSVEMDLVFLHVNVMLVVSIVFRKAKQSSCYRNARVTLLFWCCCLYH